MHAYAIWNNKGGTGKSTITFHVASRFAERHPERKVLVIDMCPQANASMLLLGGGQDGEDHVIKLCDRTLPRSVVGYLSEAILKRNTPKLDDFTVQISCVNDMMPSNLFLLSGDGNLELMAPALNDEAGRSPFPGLADPWRWVHEVFVQLRDNLDQDKWTIFFDTNPSFSIYTEIAICAATRLLVPVNADDASRIAVKAAFALIYGTNPPHPFFGNYTFAARTAARSMKLPEFHLAIGNRFTQFKGAAAAFQAFSDATADQLYEAYRNAPNRFSARTNKPKIKEDFIREYVEQLRDFNTAGVVAAHHGTPLSKMKQNYYAVHSDPDVKVNKNQINLGLNAVDGVVSRLEP